MKTNHDVARLPLRRWIFVSLLAFCLILGNLVSPAALAASPSEVSFAQALADARQVANLNTGWKIYLSEGESMRPQIDHDTLLLVAKTDYDKLSEGMLVIYRDSDGDLVSHRLITCTKDGWIAKGLNNYREDPGLVTRDNLQGVVFGMIKYQAGTDSLPVNDPSKRPAVAYAKKY